MSMFAMSVLVVGSEPVNKKLFENLILPQIVSKNVY